MTMTPAAPFLLGLGLALAVGAFATRVGFDRERSFYPTVLMVVGSYYVLFAAEGSTPSILACEAVGMALFVVAAVLGFRSSLWIVVAGLFAHGLFDAVHGHILANAGTPAWWPAFCGTYDVTAAAYLVLRLSKVSSPPRAEARAH
jgi:hypothetical protein